MNSRKTKLIIIACLCIVVLGLSIGYAVLSANLEINGTAKVESKWDVVFLKDEIKTIKTGTAECDIGKVSGTSIENMSVVFNKPGDSCTFTVPVKNTGNIPARLVDVTGKSSNLTFLGDSKDQDILRNNVTYEVNYGRNSIKSTTDFTTIPVLKENATETVTLKATFLNSSTEMPTGEVIIGGLDRAFIYENVVNGDDSSTVTPVVDNIPNPPELNGDMIPVYYDKIDDTTGTWKKADVNNENNNWYDYSKQVWANAVTVVESKRNEMKDAKVGTEIDMDDINTMWVWIPRYSYTIKSEDGNNYYGKASFGNSSPSQELPGEIDVKFISKVTETGTAQYTGSTPTNWRTNEAFDFGGEKRNGIWVGKFETTGSLSKDVQACVNESCDVSKVTIKPGLTSLRNQTISSFYFMSRSIQLNNTNTFGFNADSGDLHMMKNDEWGAVVYLSQSKYGKYGNSEYTGANKEVYINNDSGHITGHSGGSPSVNSSAKNYAYNDITNLGNGQGQAGPGASTTGNITGIYDMSGGTNEYVMGVLEYDEQGVTEHNGEIATGTSEFKGLNSSGDTTGDYDLPNEKYYNKYKSAKPTFNSFPNVKLENTCNGGICYGHALGETYGGNSGKYGWYGDYAYFVTRGNPWFIRGGDCTYITGAGVFGVSSTDGNFNIYNSTRLVLTP